MTLKNGIVLLGGFNGTETSVDQQDPLANPTILDGSSANRVVFVPAGTSIATTIDGFTIKNGFNNSYYGAGIYCNGSATISHNKITDNHSPNYGGGGISCVSGNTWIIHDNEFENNSAPAGGAVYIDAGQTEIRDNIFSSNHATTGHGGAIYLDDGAISTITGNKVSGNSATSRGGGIYAINGTATISNNNIWDNVSAGDGGGAYLNGVTSVLTGNTFSHNSAVEGGGAFVHYGSATLSRSYFYQNTAANTGGGIRMQGDPGGGYNYQVAGCTFLGNTALSGAGLLNIYAGIQVADCLFSQNQAGETGGGLYFVWTGATSIIGCTIVDNSAGYTNKGGGVFFLQLGNAGGGPHLVANSIIAFNSSGLDLETSNYTPTLTTNDVYSNTYGNYHGVTPGATDIHVDPKFIDELGGNYYLLSTSPCIDAGTDSFVLPGETDLDGNPRIYGPHVDIGCYEAGPSTYAISGLTFNPNPVAGGTNSTGTVTLFSPAPVGGALITLSSSIPGVAEPPFSVTVLAGQTIATFTVLTAPVLVDTSVSMTATYGPSVKSATLSVLAKRVVASLTLNPAAVLGGQPSTATVTLNSAAPPGGTTVTIGNNNPAFDTAPTSVTVDGGTTQKTFQIQTVAVTSAKTATISASAGGVTKTAKLTINPLMLLSLSLSSVSVVGGNSVVGTITLNGPPSVDTDVAVSSGNAKAHVPDPTSVTVHAGSSTATFLITTDVVSAKVSGPINATYGGITKSVTITVNPAVLLSLTLNPTSVIGGNTSTGTVTFASAVGADTVVTLASANSAAHVPPIGTVTVMAGSTSATFTVTTDPVVSTTTGAISASYGGVTKSVNITVKPPTYASFTLAPNPVVGGNDVIGTVTMTGPVAVDTVVTITNLKTAAIAPATATIHSGSDHSSFTLTTISVTKAVSGKVTATIGAVSNNVTLKVMP